MKQVSKNTSTILFTLVTSVLIVVACNSYQKIVQDHNGTISAKGQFGIGSTFTFFLSDITKYRFSRHQPATHRIITTLERSMLKYMK